MNVTGKTILFLDLKGKETKYPFFSTTCDSKDKDGNKIVARLSVILDKTNFPAEKIAKLDPTKWYEFEILDSFLTVETWKDGSRHPAIYVKEGKLLASHPLKPRAPKVEEGLPF